MGRHGIRADVLCGVLPLASSTHFGLTKAMSTGVRVLCDPWLTGDLVFGGQTWLYCGKKTAVRDLDVPAIGRSADLLVLSQARLQCTALHELCARTLPLAGTPVQGSSGQPAVDHPARTTCSASALRALGPTTCRPAALCMGRHALIPAQGAYSAPA